MDGEIDICDVVFLDNVINGKTTTTVTADINGDSKIDKLDADEVRKLIIS